MTEKVKTKVVELMYSWSKGLRQEGKIVEAYQMLKRQGIVKDDPSYVDQVSSHLALDFSAFGYFFAPPLPSLLDLVAFL